MVIPYESTSIFLNHKKSIICTFIKNKNLKKEMIRKQNMWQQQKKNNSEMHSITDKTAINSFLFVQ